MKVEDVEKENALDIISRDMGCTLFILQEIRRIALSALNDLSGCASDKDVELQYKWALEDILDLKWE